MTLFRPTENQIARLVRDDRPVCAFIYDLDALTDQVRTLGASLPPSSDFFYAVKANNDPRILRALARHVGGFEVASAGEVKRVRAAVGPSARIIMGGPAHTQSDIATLLAHRVERLHLESIQAMRIANAVAQARSAVLPVLLRVNLAGPVPGATLTMGGAATQFGIEEAAIPDAIAVLRDCAALRFEGFHFHTVSNNRDAAGHATLCAAELVLARRWAKEHGLDLKLVNLGGGWGVDYADLDWRFDAAEFSRRLAPHLDGRTRVQFECGRIVAAYHGVYACEIVDVKRTHGRAFALLRGGTHHFRLPSSWAHDHPFTILPREKWHHDWPRPEIANAPLTLAGELCTPKDALARDVSVERARIGDVVCFLMAGAYGWDISHHDFLCHEHPERIFIADGAVVPEQVA